MRDTIRFIDGQTDATLRDVSPTLTVLEWLRTRAGRIGTKEGCAEGDCGACTVILGEPDGDAMRYRPVNACILFVPALDGRQLITVEHLGGDHPAQTAMVDHHASQCGFCTPGFVMSLWALGQTPTDRTDVNEALAGNLCRCTGYRPIVDAALEPGRKEPGQAAMAARLRDLPSDPLHLDHDGTILDMPRTLADAVAARAKTPGATLLAGGTDVGLWVTKDRRTLPHVIALDHIPELRTISRTEDRLEIGACVPYEDALEALVHDWPGMEDMLRRLGSRQIRHRGTIGGNLGTASPIGDMAPSLLALDAEIVLAGPEGMRTVALGTYFTGYRRTLLRPDELIARIDIPLPKPGEHLHVSKITKRRDEDISSVCAAFLIRIENGIVVTFRTGFGGVAATPLRVPELEQALTGRPWTLGTIRDGQAALENAITPIDDVRASAAYRKRVAKNLLMRLWHELAELDVAA